MALTIGSGVTSNAALANQRLQQSSETSGTDNNAAAQATTGDHQYVISTRSFAPPDSFGGGFQGDSRGYSLDPNVTSRIHSEVTVDTDDQVTIGASDISAHSDPSIHHAIPFYTPTETPSADILNQSVNHDDDQSTLTFKAKHSGKDAVLDIPVPGIFGGGTVNPAPALDVYTDLKIVDDRANNTLKITGDITGDNFPATETYITDSNGQSLFLATGKPPAIATPAVNLVDFGNEREIGTVDITVNTDEAGNFVSVESEGKTIDIDEWNQEFLSRDPSFIDPFQPLNDASLEIREGGREVTGELVEAAVEIATADGFFDTTGEVIEGAGEVLYESGEAVVETAWTGARSTVTTARDIGEKAAEKIPDAFKPWKW